MPQQVDYEGVLHEFPDDFSQQDIQSALTHYDRIQVAKKDMASEQRRNWWSEQIANGLGWLEFFTQNVANPIKSGQKAVAAATSSPEQFHQIADLIDNPARIPHVAQQEGTTAQAAAGTANAAIDFANMFTDPDALMQLGLAGAPSAVRTGLLRSFGASMAIGAPQQLNAALEAGKRGDVQEAVRQAVAAGAQGYFTKKIGEAAVAIDNPLLRIPSPAQEEIHQIDRQVIAGMKLTTGPMVPALERKSELREQIASISTPEGMVKVNAPVSWNLLLPGETVLNPGQKMLDLAREVASARKRQTELQGSKLPSSGQVFPAPKPQPFEITAESKLASRQEPYIQSPDLRDWTHEDLRSVMDILRDKLSRRDWSGAVRVLGQTPSQITRPMLDTLLGVGKDSVPLTAGEKIIFNEIWENEVSKSMGRGGQPQTPLEALAPKTAEVLKQEAVKPPLETQEELRQQMAADVGEAAKAPEKPLALCI